MDFQTFYNKGPPRYCGLVHEPHAGGGSGIPNSLNACVIFIVFTYFTNVAADCIIQRGKLHAARRSRVGDT
jgi:hypothetical protein